MGHLRPEVELDHAPIPAREDGIAQVLGECGEAVREAGAGVQQSVAVEVDQEGQVSGGVRGLLYEGAVGGGGERGGVGGGGALRVWGGEDEAAVFGLGEY